MNVLTGLDCVGADPAVILGRRWALLANHAAVDCELRPARIVLAGVAGPPVRLFAPEHGLEGVAQDMKSVGDVADPVTGSPVRSLYGSNSAGLKPRSEDLEGIDVVVVDVPDMGARCYPFAAAMDAMMQACRDRGIELLVLDRPNPLGGMVRAGGQVQPGFESLVSQLPTPMRHGLTLGEIALLLQGRRYPQLELTVVQCRGWRRGQLFETTGLPWVPPLPNMPTPDTAVLYPGLCLVEATTLSEGRGTSRPFHLVGAPWIDAREFAATLTGLDLPGIAFRAASFRPELQKRAGELCAGVELHITDAEALEPLSLGLHLLQTVHDMWPESFAWRSQPYEFVSDVPALDLLTGSAAARTIVEDGGDLRALFDEWENEVRVFEGQLDGILLYHER